MDSREWNDTTGNGGEAYGDLSDEHPKRPNPNAENADKVPRKLPKRSAQERLAASSTQTDNCTQPSPPSLPAAPSTRLQSAPTNNQAHSVMTSYYSNHHYHQHQHERMSSEPCRQVGSQATAALRELDTSSRPLEAPAHSNGHSWGRDATHPASHPNLQHQLIHDNRSMPQATGWLNQLPSTDSQPTLTRHETLLTPSSSPLSSLSTERLLQEPWYLLNRSQNHLVRTDANAITNEDLLQARQIAQNVFSAMSNAAGTGTASSTSLSWNGRSNVSQPATPQVPGYAVAGSLQNTHGMNALLNLPLPYSTSGYLPVLTGSYFASSPQDGVASATSTLEGIFNRVVAQSFLPSTVSTQYQQLLRPLLQQQQHQPSPTFMSNALLTHLLGRNLILPSLLPNLTPEQQLIALQSLQQMTTSTEATPVQDNRTNASLLQAPQVHVEEPRTMLGVDNCVVPSTHDTVPMQTASDKDQLSRYQTLVRRQLEYFVSQNEDADYSVQGRKKQARLGQVGIRCKHCSHLPHRMRGRGAGYYPAKLSGVYQAAQNMATNHLNQFCPCIPPDIRASLLSCRGRERRSAPVGAGKQYWTDACVEIGLVEKDNELRFCGNGPSA